MRVTHLDPGTYAIHVVDQSDMHNFDLTGPGVSKSTEVAEVGAAGLDGHFHRRHVPLPSATCMPRA